MEFISIRLNEYKFRQLNIIHFVGSIKMERNEKEILCFWVIWNKEKFCYYLCPPSCVFAWLNKMLLLHIYIRIYVYVHSSFSNKRCEYKENNKREREKIYKKKRKTIKGKRTNVEKSSTIERNKKKNERKKKKLQGRISPWLAPSGVVGGISFSRNYRHTSFRHIVALYMCACVNICVRIFLFHSRWLFLRLFSLCVFSCRLHLGARHHLWPFADDDDDDGGGSGWWWWRLWCHLSEKIYYSKKKKEKIKKNKLVWTDEE